MGLGQETLDRCSFHMSFVVATTAMISAGAVCSIVIILITDSVFVIIVIDVIVVVIDIIIVIIIFVIGYGNPIIDIIFY